MTDLSVSIVIVTFRSAQLTVNCLRSIDKERLASGLSLHAIVVDNASGDLPVVSRAIHQNAWTSWATAFSAPRNGGFAFGNNCGIRAALESRPADYVLLLNPDTEVRPLAIATLARFLATHSDVGIAGSSFENLDGSDWPIAFRFPTLASEFCSALDIGPVTRAFGHWAVARQMPPVAQRVDWICGASMMIRPDVFRAIGGLDENYFLYFEETDFCLRAMRAGFPTWYVPESRVMHIGGQSTGVTERNSRPKRLPPYWFESRRRYFVVALGLAQAMTIDVLVLLSYPLGWLKRLLLRQAGASIPHFWRDLARATVLRPGHWRDAGIRESAELHRPHVHGT